MNRKIRDAIEMFCVEEFGIQPNLDDIEPLINSLDKHILANYFGNKGNWKPDNKQFKATGTELIDKVNALNPQSVLDIGCGYNLLKSKIQNLWGIDPYNSHADEMIDLMDFPSTTMYDVVLVLGSINFGCEESIKEKLAKAVSLCEPRGHIFFRVNPGLEHRRAGAEWVDFFEWSPKKLEDFALENDCECIDVQEDRWRMDGDGLRYYAHWIRGRDLQTETVSIQNMGR
mgnify:FL=1|tara:strand:+ start:310 stop:996 length:687 start_codon:yes stop_codon:yes gene_type:complete